MCPDRIQVTNLSRVRGYRALSSKDRTELKKFIKLLALTRKYNSETTSELVKAQNMDKAYKEIYG